jgi:hypothetical protein
MTGKELRTTALATTPRVIMITQQEQRILCDVEHLMRVIPREMPVLVMPIPNADIVDFSRGGTEWLERQMEKSFSVSFDLIREVSGTNDRRRLGRIVRDRRRGGHRKPQQ